MKRILISGGDGEFAKELQKCNSEYEIIAPSKEEMDITDIESVDFGVGYYKPDYFIHAGALTRPMVIHESEPDKSIITNIFTNSGMHIKTSSNYKKIKKTTIHALKYLLDRLISIISQMFSV